MSVGEISVTKLIKFSIKSNLKRYQQLFLFSSHQRNISMEEEDSQSKNVRLPKPSREDSGKDPKFIIKKIQIF